MRHFITHNPGRLALVWALVIFFLCATPGQYIPSADWMELLSIDKLVHASIFFVLCVLAFGSLMIHQKQQGYYSVVIVLAILYGISLEWMQAEFFHNRTAD